MEGSKRWTVEANYKNNVVFVFQVEELEDIQMIIEYGPDWADLINAVITYNYKDL